MASLQLGDQLRLGSPDLVQRALADRGQVTDGATGSFDLLRGELEVAVVVQDRGLDLLRMDVESLLARHTTDSAGAEEVGVLAAVTTGRDGVGHAPAARSTEDASSQIVVPKLWPFASDGLLGKQELDSFERLRVDQRLVPTRERLLIRLTTVMRDHTDVVRIAEQALESRRRNRLRLPAAKCPCAEPQAIQLLDELRDRVLASGVKLEGDGNEEATIGIDLDGLHASTFWKFVDDVAVAQRSLAGGAADLSLLTHAVADVLGRLHGLELVVRGDHALVEEGRSRVFTGHRLGDRDQACASLADDLAGLPVVDRIAGKPAERPDDDEVDPRGRSLVPLLEFFEHGEEAGALVQIDVGRLARVAEFADDLGLELGRLVGRTAALGVDRQTVVAVVGLDLSVGGHAKVGKGPRSSHRLGRSLGSLTTILGQAVVIHIASLSFVTNGSATIRCYLTSYHVRPVPEPALTSSLGLLFARQQPYSVLQQSDREKPPNRRRQPPAPTSPGATALAPASTGVPPPSSPFDRLGTVSWALVHNQDKPPAGAACTWFVSQALWAGGLAKTAAWTSDGSHGHLQRRPGSVASWWTPDFVRYIRGAYPRSTYTQLQFGPKSNGVPNAQVGDVILYDWYGKSSATYYDKLRHASLIVDLTADHYPIVAEWGVVDGASRTPYVSRGWTWSKLHDEYLQVEYPKVQAYLLHIDTGQ